MPGVQRAAITSSLPLGKLNDTRTEVKIEGIPPSDPSIPLMAGYRAISPNYFRTMGISLIKGRDFAERDNKDSAPAVIVNESFVRLYLMNADPIGQKIISGMGIQSPKEIVGVVADFRHAGLDLAPEPEMYVPYGQDTWSSVTLVVRTSDKPERLTATVQNAVWAIEKNLSLGQVRTMKNIISELVSRPRFNLMLLGIFSLVAMALAAVGVYGVLSFMVTQNTREIGVRLALGAQTGDVLKLVILQGMRWTIIGVSLGLVVAFGLTRLRANLLYEISVTDPLTLIGVTALLMSIALLACYIPARRATKVDPMVALRWE
jgi:putative ABC transport system permease protein